MTEKGVSALKIQNALLSTNVFQPLEYVTQIPDSSRGRTGKKPVFNCKGTGR